MLTGRHSTCCLSSDIFLKDKKNPLSNGPFEMKDNGPFPLRALMPDSKVFNASFHFAFILLLFMKLKKDLKKFLVQNYQKFIELLKIEII